MYAFFLLDATQLWVIAYTWNATSLFYIHINPSHPLRPPFIFSRKPSLIPLAHSDFFLWSPGAFTICLTPLFFLFRLCNQFYFYGYWTCSVFMSCLFNWVAGFLRSWVMYNKFSCFLHCLAHDECSHYKWMNEANSNFLYHHKRPCTNVVYELGLV